MANRYFTWKFIPLKFHDCILNFITIEILAFFFFFFSLKYKTFSPDRFLIWFSLIRFQFMFNFQLISIDNEYRFYHSTHKKYNLFTYSYKLWNLQLLINHFSQVRLAHTPTKVVVWSNCVNTMINCLWLPSR